jgi:GPH family glycoside/pentoside/hexuronide:cation symporter
MSESHANEETSKPQVPTSKRFLWGIGGFADCMMYNGINGLVDPIYNMGMGISAEVIGLARSVPRFADLIIDPIIGHMSDNTRSRWGRRKPWMLAGALIAGLVSMGMWFVPTGLGAGAANAFVVTMMVLLFTFGYSLYVIPYTGQGYEMTTDYNERTHLFQWRQYAYAVGGFLTPWLFWLCMKLDTGPGGIAKEQANGLYGIRWVGIGVGVIILISALAPILFCKDSKSEHQENKVSFREALGFTRRNKAFWPLVIGNFLLKFGMVSTGIFFLYLLIYNVAGGDKEQGGMQWGIFCNTINVATFVAMALVVRMVDRLGKKPAMLLLMLASAVTYVSVWFTFRSYASGPVPAVAAWMTNSIGIPSAIAAAWPIYLTAAGIGVFCNCLPLLMNSMLADVCDVDELASGSQRQAFYGAIFATCDKIAMGVAMLLQGFLLTASKFDPHAATVSASTIEWWMKALLFSQPTGFIIAFLVILAYPITRASAAETRRLLEARRGKTS